MQTGLLLSSFPAPPQVLKQFHVLAVQNTSCQTLGLDVTVSGSIRRDRKSGHCF